jgi:hypothetical protein
MTARWCAAILLVAAMSATTAVKPKTFGSPEQAAEALVKAAKPFDVAALKEILGSDGIDLVETGEPVQDKKQAEAFAALYEEKHRIERDPKDSSTATLILGNEDWPAPIPIVQKKGAWQFDTKAGRKEILFRRVGRNELDAIEVCRGYVEAQNEYVLEKHDGSTVPQYAQRIIASPGKQDGLAWKKPDGTWDGPVGESVARVIAEGYTDKFEPYHGYHFKVLKGQGPSAPLGTMDYVIKGAMIGGFALAAAPAEYAVTGVKSFIVSQDGVVYERDFGEHTAEWFKAAVVFNPDSKWSPVVDAE